MYLLLRFICGRSATPHVRLPLLTADAFCLLHSHRPPTTCLLHSPPPPTTTAAPMAKSSPTCASSHFPLALPLSMLMPTAHVSHLLLRRRRLRQLTDVVHCGSSSITSSSIITRHCSSSEPAASSYAKSPSGRWNSDTSSQTYYLFFNLPYTPPILYFRILRNSSYFRGDSRADLFCGDGDPIILGAF